MFDLSIRLKQMDNSFKILRETPDEVYWRVYNVEIAGWNREDRRTKAGRIKVAEAKNVALKAKIKALEDKIEELQNGY